jgi:hypothetical protein
LELIYGAGKREKRGGEERGEGVEGIKVFFNQEKYFV